VPSLFEMKTSTKNLLFEKPAGSGVFEKPRIRNKEVEHVNLQSKNENDEKESSCFSFFLYGLSLFSF
jgi:hypothetical protein